VLGMVYPPILYVNVAVGNFEEVDNVNKAKKALGGAGLSYTEGTLEQFELANKPGALAELAGPRWPRISASTRA